jgi:methylase of polypeptide subunit release factors
MNVDELISALGYEASPNFLRGDAMGRAIEYAHVFRSARHSCNLQGVYMLQEDSAQQDSLSTPVVYVARAETIEAADEIHRKIWNQNIVPFLVVWTPVGVRLYSGFWYERPKGRGSHRRAEPSGLLEPSVSFSAIADRLGNLRAAAIDDGTLWRERGSEVTPEQRVDWKLLANLRKLGDKLHSEMGLEPEIAHALIGKFVYLRYLHDRGILSPRKLEEWGLDHDDVFGRHASVRAMRALVDHVDDWLNGAIFPLNLVGPKAPLAEHLRQVTSVFLGDHPDDGQLHLDFRAYDFSFIPIETLSIIYEQFLHAAGKGQPNGAYYTPIPLVNFMVSELNDACPLRRGMRVFDPSCGSGAFLVHCYRRLIEQHMRDNGGQRPRPVELRELLVRHIFGLDRDPDACQVAVLSLILTMLDYIEPRDLKATPTFKLPELHNTNIFEGDFFDSNSPWYAAEVDRTYHWILGNPPWIQLKPKEIEKAEAEKKEHPEKKDHPDRHAWDWMSRNRNLRPVVANEVAEAFAWEVASNLKQGGVIGLLMPAMTLFRERAAFRAQFFMRMEVRSVANFSNLREVLFAGRARMPAAVLFYSPRSSGEESASRSEERRAVLLYSPMVANQEANLPPAPGERRETWTITLDRSEVRVVPHRKICNGEPLPWKTAMWGSPRDERLLMSLARRHPALKAFADSHGLAFSQGLKLRDSRTSKEKLLPAPEVAGKYELNIEVLRNLTRIHSFPNSALHEIDEHYAWVRARSGISPIEVCRPPHIAVSAARNFAVYCDDYLVIPDPHVGIAGSRRQEALLRALTLFLNSDFVTYHQFFTSPQEGIRDGRVTLASLKRLPMPLGSLDTATLNEWAELHRELVAAALKVAETGPPTPTLWLDRREAAVAPDELKRVEARINELTASALGLDETQRWLIDDLVHVRMSLSDGQFAEIAVRPPIQNEFEAYASALERGLDGHLANGSGRRHRVAIAHDQSVGMVLVELVDRAAPVAGSRVLPINAPAAQPVLALYGHLRAQRGQWRYFERNLLRFDGVQNLLLKPMQRVWWTRSQALADADEIRAEKLHRMRAL